ncbi:uncharacterized protein ACB058_001852 isoform 2-T2 [Synchiropus picturatus]
MAEQRAEGDAAASETRTARAAALARLLHQESCQLLQLYKERETFPADHTPDGGRMVSLSLGSEEPSAEEQKEEEEWGELDGEYENLRKAVRLRLEYLLHSTKDLVESEDLPVSPDTRCTEEVDGAGGGFGLKMWTYRVLLELIHWADHAAQTLHILHTERKEAQEI